MMMTDQVLFHSSRGTGRPVPGVWPSEDVGAVAIDPVDLMRGLARRWRTVLGAAVALALTALFIGAVQAPRFTARVTLALDPGGQGIPASDRAPGTGRLGQAAMETEVALLRAPDLLRQVIAGIGADRLAMLGNDEPQIFAALEQGVRVSRVGGSHVISVAATTPEAALSVLIANGLADAYIEAGLTARQNSVDDAVRWLTGEVASRKSVAMQAEARLDAARRAALSRAGASKDMIDQQLLDLTRHLTLTRADRTGAESRLTQLTALLGSAGAQAAGDLIDAPGLTALREMRRTLFLADARLSGIQGVAHPDRKRIAAELAEVARAIEGEVTAVVSGLRTEVGILGARDAALSEEVTALEVRLSDMATADLELGQLEREAATARQGYEDLALRLVEVRGEAGTLRPDARVLSAAGLPQVSSGPRIGLMTAFGGSVGLTIGLLIALAAEAFGTGFSRAEDVQRRVQLPVLSVLPEDRSATRAAMIADRMRHLRSVLAVGNQARCVALVSSRPGEGLETLGHGLASACVDAGQHAVVVDFGMPPEEATGEGLSSAGGDADVLVLRPAPDQIAGVGDAEADAARFTGELRDRFDVVILILPPVLESAGPLSAARIADRLIYLVRADHTPRRSVLCGLGILHSLGLRPDGVVLCGADPTRDPDAYAGGKA